MAAITEILAKLKIDTSESSSKLGSVQQQISSLGKAANVPLNVDTAGAAKSIGSVDTELQRTVRSIDTWKADLRSLKAERDKAEDPAKIAELNKQIQFAEEEVKRLKTPIKEAFDPKSVDSFDKSVKGISGDLKGVEQSAGGLGSAFKQAFQIGGGLAVVQQITGTLGSLSDATIQFDKNIANVGSLGVSNFKQIGGELLSLSKTIPKEAGDLANATYQAISAGIDSNKAVGFVEDAAKVAVAGGASTEAAVNGLTSVLNAYKLKTEDASKISDIFFGTIKYGKTTFNEMNAALANVVPAASAVGLGFDEVGAAIAAMTAQGVPTAQASTQIRQALVEIQKPGKDLQAVMKDAGVSIADLSNPAIGLTGVLEKINQSAAKQGKSMTQVFSSVEAGSAALLLSGQNFESARAALDNVRGSTGAAGEAFDVMNQSLDSQLQLAKNYVTSALIPIAQTLLGGVLTGINAVRSAFDFVTGTLGKSKLAMGALAAVAVVLFGPAAYAALVRYLTTMAAGTAQAALSVLSKLVPALVTQTVTTEGAEAAQLALNASMLLSPIGIITGLVAGAAVAYALFSKHTNTLEESTQGLHDALEQNNEAIAKAKKIEDTAKNVEKLADEYDKLSKSTKPEDQKRLAEVTRDLDKATGGAATTFDLYSSRLNINTEAARLNADQQLRIAENIRKQSLDNLIAASADLGDRLSEAEARLLAVKKVANDRTKVDDGILSSALDKIGAGGDKALSDYRAAAEEVRRLTGLIAAAKKEAEPLGEQFLSGFDEGQIKAKGLVQLANEFSDKFNIPPSDADEILKNVLDARAAGKQVEDNKKKAAAADAARKAAQEDLLALAKREADAAAEELETKLRMQRLNEKAAFTTRDELRVQQAHSAEFQKQIDSLKVLTAQKGKFKARAELEIDKEAVKDLTLLAKVRFEREQAQKALQAATIALGEKEIEVGIRPKTDAVSLLQKQIDQVGQDLALANAKLALNPFDLDTLTAAANFKSQYLDLVEKQASASEEIQRRLSEARIAIIQDETERSIDERSLQFQQDLKFVRQAIEAGRELTAGEKALKKAIETKYYQDIAEIRRKAHKDEKNDLLDLNKGISDLLTDQKNIALGFLRDYLDKSKEINQAEVEDKRRSFNEEQTALRASLQKGEISQRTYDKKLRKLQADRAKFEADVNANLWDKLSQGATKFLEDRLAAVASYYADLGIKYLLDAALHSEAEGTKTAATLSGTSARVSASGTEVAANAATANSSILSAAANSIANAFKATPFPLDILAAAGAAAAVYGLYRGAKALLGFETGGIGLVGEKGPEVIGPTKDFSQMATQLVRETARATERALRQRDSETGVRFGGRIEIGGRLISRGRDVEYQLAREDRARRTEKLIQDR